MLLLGRISGVQQLFICRAAELFEVYHPSSTASADGDFPLFVAALVAPTNESLRGRLGDASRIVAPTSEEIAATLKLRAEVAEQASR